MPTIDLVIDGQATTIEAGTTGTAWYADDRSVVAIKVDGTPATWTPRSKRAPASRPSPWTPRTAWTSCAIATRLGCGITNHLIGARHDPPFRRRLRRPVAFRVRRR